jgi:hypothetical protein
VILEKDIHFFVILAPPLQNVIEDKENHVSKPPEESISEPNLNSLKETIIAQEM